MPPIRTPVKPFPSYKWRWLSVQPSEGLLKAPVFLGVLRALHHHEGQPFSSIDLFRELQRVELDTGSSVTLARSLERNLFRNSGQYWRGTGLLSRSSGSIELTDLGREISVGDLTNDQFAALMVRNTVLPNPATYSPNQIELWRTAGLRIKPLEVILGVMDRLGRSYSDSEASLSANELIKVVIPLAGEKRNLNEIADCVISYRRGALDVSGWPDCAPEANDKRLAREFLLFLENFGVCQSDSQSNRYDQRFFIDQVFDQEVIPEEGETFTERAILLPEEIERSRSSEIPMLIERQRVTASVIRRSNQPRFRREVLAAANSRCLLTNEAIPDVLEAAHIIPVTDGGTENEDNGICLRVDVHRLYDAQKLRINANGDVWLSDQLRDSINYRRIPSNVTLPPSVSRANVEWRMRYR